MGKKLPNDPAEVVRTWWTLNTVLMDFDEEGVRKLLQHEQRNQGRARFLDRIHARYCELRRAREREDILKGAKIGRQRQRVAKPARKGKTKKAA